MEPIEFMQKTYPKFEDIRVLVVSVPLPPLHVRGLIYTPNCFASKTFDREFSLSDSTYRAVSMAPSRFGPAILLSIRLGDLVKYGADGMLDVVRSSCCATVSYAVKYSMRDGYGGRWDYADAATIDNINFRHSCNPGSHVSVPGAPFLTALLQRDSAPKYLEKKIILDSISYFEYLSPEESGKLFPAWNFSNNTLVDSWLGLCVCDKRLESDLAGIGQWAMYYLRQLRLNRIMMHDNKDYGAKFLMEQTCPTSSL